MSQTSDADDGKITNNDIAEACPKNFGIVDVHPMRVIWGATCDSEDIQPGELKDARVELDISERLQVVSTTTRYTGDPANPVRDRAVILESNIDTDASEYVIETQYGPDETVHNPTDVHRIAIDAVSSEMRRLADATPSLMPV